MGRLAHVAEPGKHEVGLDRLQRLGHFEGDRSRVRTEGHHQNFAVGRRVEGRLRERGRRERHRVAFFVLLHGLPLVLGRGGSRGAASVMAHAEAVNPTLVREPRPQYVARPPERSNTPPVENEQSSEQSQATIAAISFGRPKRPSGIFDFIMSMWVWVIWSKMRVSTAAGVTQLTSTPEPASSLPRLLVSAMRPPFAAL